MIAKIAIPKKIAQVVDLYAKTREKRLAMEKEVETVAKVEAALRDHLIREIPKGAATGVSGKIARVEIYTDEVPQVEDWNKFYTYVKKNNAFDLLQRRLNGKAVEERWNAKKKVAGVGVFKAVKISLTKVRHNAGGK